MSDFSKRICVEKGLDWLGFQGGGAFKDVFKVQTSQGNLRVLKIAKEPGMTQRGAREIEILQRCNHPNIAAVHEVGAAANNGHIYPFIIEDFCGGESLGDLLRGGGDVSEDLILRVGLTLIDCLSYLRSMHLVHRDIKPDNIMVDSDGKIALVDFGLVRDLADVSLTLSWVGMGPGTPYYASPEQLNNQKEQISWRTDQFSLGVTLCELLGRFHPYQNTSDHPRSIEIVQRVASRASHGDMVAYLNERGDVLKRMTNKWPIGRFHEPASLAEAWGSTFKS